VKIFILNSAPKYTGEAAHSVDLTEQLIAHGHQVLLILRSDNIVADHARRRGIPVAATLSYRFDPHLSIRDIKTLRQLILREQPDIIHCHRGNDHGLAALVIATLRKKPALVRTRHRVIPVNLGRLNRWLFLRATDGIISVSQCAAKSFGPMLRWIEPRHTIVYSSADTEYFNPDRRSVSWRQTNGITDDRIIIGLIARLQRVKGQVIFLKAAALVGVRHPQVRFLIAGGGVPRRHEKLKQVAAELGLADRVLFFEWLPEINEAMASLDVGVLASLGSEGSSRITYEYMASGLPIIATAVGCIPEVITDDKTGLVVEPNDPEALARAMEKLLNNPEKRKQLAINAHQRSQDFYNRKRWLEETIAAYQKAIIHQTNPRGMKGWFEDTVHILRLGQQEATHKSSNRFRQKK